MSDGEVLGFRDPMEIHRLGDRSLGEWHRWLTHNEQGEFTGRDATPNSRYGDTGYEVAWWALAYELSYIELGGVHDSPEEYEAGVEAAMSAAVNDEGYVAAWISLAWNHLPSSLQNKLGLPEEVRERLR